MAMPAPVSVSRPIICHSCGCPNRTSRPNPPSPTAIITLAATMTRCGAKRSANTPPTRANTSDGRICAAST